MPEPSSAAQAEQYIALKQSQIDLSSSLGDSEVPRHEPTSREDRDKPDEHERNMQVDHQQTTHQEEEQKAGPILATHPHQPPYQLSSSLSSQQQLQSQSNAALMMPPPPLPLFNFGSYNNRAEWNGTIHRPSTRPPLPPQYPSSASAHHHLHAPRPSHPYESAGASRMRGDGFLLDADDEPDGLDISSASESEAAMQTQRSATAGVEEDSAYRMFGMPILGESMGMSERPRSAGPSFTVASSISRSSTGDSSIPQGLNAAAWVCPSCGEQPAQAELISSHAGTEAAFHAHVARCFASASSSTASPGRARKSMPPAGSPQTAAAAVSDGGPIRKTRGRAASAAATTGNAAELASAIAREGAATPEKEHGYHPYSGAGNANLTSALRQLRRTVDQLDLHQRISIMEAFHRLSRTAIAEHQQTMSTPRGKGKLRSATNSPSPKHKPVHEDKVCSNILSLLYSPRITAPHPSPSYQMSGLAIGVPSPLAIGLPLHGAGVSSIQARTLGVPGAIPMDTLELGATHASDAASMSKSYLFSSMSPEPTPPIEESLFHSPVQSPNSHMADGSESEAGGVHSALALNGTFVNGLSSGASSPASSTPPSEQTSPSAPTDGGSTYTTSERSQHMDQFPSHCFPAAVHPMGTPSGPTHTAHSPIREIVERDARKRTIEAKA
ncbi:MAG: hypothetical protein P4M09_18980 [Devosia sp.]|nr:hypothetical protein [Devosia sp.]